MTTPDAFNLMFLSLWHFIPEDTKKNNNNIIIIIIIIIIITYTLQSLLLHNSHHSPDLHRDNLLSTWLTTFSSITPAAPSNEKQSAWDKPVIAVI